MSTSPALLAPLASLLLGAPATSSPPFNPEPPACAFTLLVDRSGIHQVRFDALKEAAAAEDPAVAVAPIKSANLQLSHLGKTLKIHVADGGDGLFGPGDHIEFLGEPPRGEKTAFDESVRFNAYRLNGCAAAPAGARRERAPLPAQLPETREILRVADHLEQDRLFLRFHQFGFGKDQPERWYWAKLTQIDPVPFTLPIDLRSYAPAAGPLRLTLDLRGWSYGSGSRVQQKDHVVELTWNGKPLGTFESNAQERLRIEIPQVPAELIGPGRNNLGLRIPPRTGSDGQPIIDVTMLNWVEVEFPRRRRLDSEQQRIVLGERKGASTVVLSSEEKGELLVFDEGGRRWDSRSYKRETNADGTRYVMVVPEATQELYTVANGAFRQPAAIEVDYPSQLAARGNQADYLMIVHPSLKSTLAPLAELHRRRGLKVEVVDVRDIYDEYSHGLRRAEAIRDFISDAWHNWQAPKPRWVLLVGDASWDSRNEEVSDSNYADWTYQPGEVTQFVKNGSTPYADAGKKSRDLIPAYTWEMYQGHAASDNFFVSIDGDDYRPDLAIGRLPIVEKEELAGIISKIESYLANVEAPQPADWQNRALFIANQEIYFQDASDKLSDVLAKNGVAIEKVYPPENATDNQASAAALTKAFNDGQALVHFIGHGGRYIWRTGPEDLKRNNDLFTLKDLDNLSPTQGFPFVLSLTCYSAPFDHPTADSIGEKLLRMADKGAIAVLAAAWRNSPPPDFSQKILEQVQIPGRTIGEAVLAGKRLDGMSEDAIRQYNLLGDPALPLALPPKAPAPGTPQVVAVQASNSGMIHVGDPADPAAQPAAAPAEQKAPHPEWLRNRIKWQTASEVDNFGYDIYRGPKEEGPFEKITVTPIPGHGTTDEPSQYEYYDEKIEEGVEYWYYVESISIQGDREKFTPIFKAKVKVRPAEESGGKP